MSRSGYHDDFENWSLIRWRGAVASATRGAKGQRLLTDLAAAMDAMPVKRLIPDSLITADGEFCTLGVLGQARGIDIKALDADDFDSVAQAFGVAPALAREIVFENDEGSWNTETPEQRWQRMREWVRQNTKTQ